jgi:phage-related baseplate assembly protein
MPLSVNQVLARTTKAKTLAFLLDTLESLGFVTGSWHDGSVQRNVLEACADLGAEYANTVANIVEATLVKPRGPWLDLIGLYRFGIPRLEAVATIRHVRLTSAASAPPHVIAIGSYLASETIRFKVTATPEGSALNAGEDKLFEVTAEFGGVAGNLPNNSELAVQTPAYSGVSAAFEGDLIVPGVDIESDDRYWLRCQLRFSELTYSVGLRAYEFWALTAAPSIRRVRAINDYPTDDMIRVVLDPGLSGEIAAVEAYIAGRQPPNDEPSVSAANVVQQQVTYAPRAPASLTVATMNAEIQAYFDTMPIGGELIAGASAGRILREKITESLLCRMGVQTVGLTVPETDVILGPTEIVEGVFTVSPEVLT